MNGSPELIESGELLMKRISRWNKEAKDVRRHPWSTLLRRLGATRLGVWVIKHVISPLDRWLYQHTAGQRVALGRPLGQLLLLTTKGRRTGKEHTTPVYYLRDGNRLVLCNVNPGFEHPNPWTLNLQANPVARGQPGRDRSLLAATGASMAGLSDVLREERAASDLPA